MKQLIEIQSWPFQSIRDGGGRKPARETNYLKDPLLSSSFANCLLLLWLLAGHKGGLKYHEHSHLCIPEKKASPPTSSKERLSAHISLSLSAQILKHFWQHVCITPMQCYRRRSQKSKIPQISLGHFRNIVYPTGGE